MVAKRRFGRVRRLPSGRWQARYKGPDGLDRPAPGTFASKTDAERWLALTEAEIIRDDWIDPDAGRVPFIEYANSWVAERPNLRPKTLQLYKGLVRLHMTPALGALTVQEITEPRVRRWRKGLLDAGVGEVTVAKAGPPKSEAGRRIVTLPAFVMPEIAAHLGQFTGPDADSFVFVGPKNAPLRRSNFTRIWQCATESAELTGFHIHDLRHTGNHFAAVTGASLRELMGRMGHSTTRAAVIYQHRTTERDRFIAAAMSQIIEAELANPDSPSGTQRARDHDDDS
jgi:integrase-like protein